MAAIADFLVSEATYSLGRQLQHVLRHALTDQGVMEGQVVDKMTLASDIREKTYVTAFGRPEGWQMGERLRTYMIDGRPFIRIDDNRVPYDNLGPLPEVNTIGSEPASAQGRHLPPAKSALDELRERHMRDDTPEQSQNPEYMDYAEPPGLSASDILEDRKKRLGAKAASETQDDLFADPLSGISDADIAVYSDIYGARSPESDDDEAKALAAGIREWIAQGRPALRSKPKPEPPAEPEPEPESSAEPEPEIESGSEPETEPEPEPPAEPEPEPGPTPETKPEPPAEPEPEPESSAEPEPEIESGSEPETEPEPEPPAEPEPEPGPTPETKPKPTSPWGSLPKGFAATETKPESTP